jgi:hypothetical protein
MNLGALVRVVCHHERAAELAQDKNPRGTPHADSFEHGDDRLVQIRDESLMPPRQSWTREAELAGMRGVVNEDKRCAEASPGKSHGRRRSVRDHDVEGSETT